MERIVALLILIFLFPFFLFVILLIILESKGSPFYVQERIGKDKRKFKIYKFRSMFVNSDKRLEEYFKTNPMAKEEWEKYRKLKTYDPRITKVGKWLRAYSLDELPQLINILKGEMSFVGPRPYVPEEVKRFSKENEIIFKVKPGLTGPWQTGGRNKLSFEERLKIETQYVKKKTLKEDIKILLKTFPCVLKKDGAF